MFYCECFTITAVTFSVYSLWVFLNHDQKQRSERTFANLQTVVLTLSDSYDIQLIYSKKLSRERESQPGAELEDQLGQKLSCKPCLTEK